MDYSVIFTNGSVESRGRLIYSLSRLMTLKREKSLMEYLDRQIGTTHGVLLAEHCTPLISW